MDGWMGLYWGQFARGFRQAGHRCKLFDYRRAGPRGLVRRLLGARAEDRLRRARTKALCRAIESGWPDLLIIHSLRFDLPELRDFYRGALVYWDIDGPAGPLADAIALASTGFDLLLTVSRPIHRLYSGRCAVPVRYLPHGADLEHYCPGPVPVGQDQAFRSPLAFLGRPTERRVRLLEPLTGDGLRVWGERWRKVAARAPAFRSCLGSERNIVGKDVLTLYRAAGVMLNISREPFTDPPNTLNLQVFHVPASGGCLLTEWVEELPDAFEPDREIVTFRGPEELQEKAVHYARDHAAARRIGEAGRRRCEAEHSLRHRATRLLELLAEVGS
jgi:spore maturation protein CgeB